MTVPSGLRALRHRDFRVFFAGQAVALVGAWMQQVAQAWLVLSLTNSPLRLGLVGSLNFLPILLFALVGGAVADRLPKRRLLVLTQSLLFCQTLTLALLIVTDHVRYWHICVLALVWGVANTIDVPVRQAFVVELAGRADGTSAGALNSAAFNVARIVGPGAAGVLRARVVHHPEPLRGALLRARVRVRCCVLCRPGLDLHPRPVLPGRRCALPARLYLGDGRRRLSGGAAGRGARPPAWPHHEPAHVHLRRRLSVRRFHGRLHLGALGRLLGLPRRGVVRARHPDARALLVAAARARGVSAGGLR